MASDDRTATDTLALFREMESEPWRFGFLSTLRRLSAAYPRQPGLGRSLRPADDPVRLGQPPTMAFAPAEIESFVVSAAGGKPQLRSFFMGLFGPNGPLPLHLTEYARDRLRNSKDPTFAAFADIFHHRMQSLFYRAWANAQPAVSFDPGGEDRFATYVGSLQGIGMEALTNRDAIADHNKFFYAGRFSSQSRTAEGLTDILQDYFGVPVKIIEFMGTWLAIAPHERTRLGLTRDTATLALNATLGESVWGCQHNFRVRLGPLDIQTFESFLPGEASLERLVALVRMYIGDEMAWDLNLVLRGPEVPELRLGQRGSLGQTSWLQSQCGGADRDEAILHPLHYSK